MLVTPELSHADLRSELRWLASGFLLTLCSGFGQTYFIALFAGHLKADLAISDGQFGGIYAAGTLASAALLLWAGKFADVFSVRALGLGVLAGLAAVSVAMASVSSAAMLFAVIFGLRFFGQGMMTHVAMTAMGRWFNKKRGRAVSIAALGFPAGEALLPLAAVIAIAGVGWRHSWLAAAAVLILLPGPVLMVLLKRERKPSSSPAPGGDAGGEIGPGAPRRQWTRGEVLRSPLFYAIMPGVLAPPFIQTGIFFNQVTIVTVKGWQLSWVAASFPVLAATNIFAALAAGWLVDRFGARRLLAVSLLPLACAALTLACAESAYVLPAFMALIGLTAGSSQTINGALWAELYGTTHLGAIRSLAVVAMVFATALSPGLIGLLLDAGVGMETQLVWLSGYCLAAAAWMWWLTGRLNRLATG